jgi:hypothetical protein
LLHLFQSPVSELGGFVLVNLAPDEFLLGRQEIGFQISVNLVKHYSFSPELVNLGSELFVFRDGGVQFLAKLLLAII